MDWERVSNDEIDSGVGHFLGLMSAAAAAACEWLMEADRRQQFLADGARDLGQWVSARFGLRHSSAVQLVGVARRLQDLPLLRERFGAGELVPWIRWMRISRMATPDTEQALMEEVLGLSNAALDRAARRAHPPTVEDEQRVWRDRWLTIQHTLDGTEGRLHARLPGADLHLVETAIRERADRFRSQPRDQLVRPVPGAAR